MDKTKKNIKVRDLKPKKDAKGGGGFSPNSGGISSSGGGIGSNSGGTAPNSGGIAPSGTTSNN